MRYAFFCLLHLLSMICYSNHIGDTNLIKVERAKLLIIDKDPSPPVLWFNNKQQHLLLFQIEGNIDQIKSKRIVVQTDSISHLKESNLYKLTLKKEFKKADKTTSQVCRESVNLDSAPKEEGFSRVLRESEYNYCYKLVESDEIEE